MKKTTNEIDHKKIFRKESNEDQTAIKTVLNRLKPQERSITPGTHKFTYFIEDEQELANVSKALLNVREDAKKKVVQVNQKSSETDKINPILPGYSQVPKVALADTKIDVITEGGSTGFKYFVYEYAFSNGSQNSYIPYFGIIPDASAPEKHEEDSGSKSKTTTVSQNPSVIVNAASNVELELEEKVVIMIALKYLQNSDAKVAVVDIFKRNFKEKSVKKLGNDTKGIVSEKSHTEDSKGSNIGTKKPKLNKPEAKISQVEIDRSETHAVLLVKFGLDKYFVLDPSNSMFSNHLSVSFKNSFKESDNDPDFKKFELITSNKMYKIYTPDKGKIGPGPEQWRDCIDIAVKLGFALSDENIEKIQGPTLKNLTDANLKDIIGVSMVTNNSDINRSVFFPAKEVSVRGGQSSNLEISKFCFENIGKLNTKIQELLNLLEKTKEATAVETNTESKCDSDINKNIESAGNRFLKLTLGKQMTTAYKHDENGQTTLGFGESEIEIAMQETRKYVETSMTHSLNTYMESLKLLTSAQTEIQELYTLAQMEPQELYTLAQEK